LVEDRTDSLDNKIAKFKSSLEEKIAGLAEKLVAVQKMAEERPVLPQI